MVNGTLYVITSAEHANPIPQNTTGDTLAAIPYSYTVG